MARANTLDLQDPDILEFYKGLGYGWIRKMTDRPFHQIVRNPTIGCVVELYAVRHVDCVPIDSPKGKKLISKLCYF
jgi:hypothetical protein